MSFILDALKKSENERQRQIGPSLADTPVSRRKGDKPWWAVAVAALLVINLGVLLVVLTRSGDDVDANAAPAYAPRSVPANAAPPVAARTQPTPLSQRPVAGGTPAAHALADEAAVADAEAVDPLVNANPNLAAAAAVPERPPIVRPIDPPSVAPAPVPAARAQQSSQEVLPTAMELAAAGTNVPDLRLDIHVYSANAAERFIFINMRKYTEGQTLTEGPTVERITPDGVVLNQRGLRYLMPRQ